MDAHHSVQGVVMLDVEGLELTATERALLQRPAVGGLILFSRNYQSPRQLRELIAAVRECRPDIIVGVDQEGGPVQRFRDGFLKLPPLHALGQLHQQDPRAGIAAARECGWAMAAELLHHGLDLSFAPVLDRYRERSRVIGRRAFSGPVDAVASLARAYIAGMGEAGMAATGKHYPGHGSVVADSHVELPRDERSAAAILNDDYRVFALCADKLAAIMPAHVIYPAIDSLCAGYSKVWIQDKLRRQLSFDGVVFSDDLSMAAARQAGAPERRTALALEAGCDMVLVCNDRAAALAVCDWVEGQGVVGNERIGRMRANPSEQIPALHRQDRWERASALVARLCRQP